MEAKYIKKLWKLKDYEKVKSDYAERSSGCITLERENESDYFSYRALKGTQYIKMIQLCQPEKACFFSAE